MRFIAREPNKAYVSSMLWLPKANIRVAAVKGALEFLIPQQGEAKFLQLWDETERHLLVPREFIPTNNYLHFGFPFVDITPHSFPRTNIRSRVELREVLPNGKVSKQKEAFSSFNTSQGGILNLAPGKGKTTLSCHKMAHLQVPSLVVVHNTYLMEQWKERIAQFIELPPGERVGIVQGPEFDWQHPITIAMIHTLAARARDGALPREFLRHFGATFFDEVHHLAADFFSQAAPICLGRRYGLTATTKRADGMEFVYNYHLGGTFYTDMEMDLVPLVFFQQTPTDIDLKKGKGVRDRSGEVNLIKLRATVANDTKANDFRYKCIKEAFDDPADRKLLVLSHSKQQLIDMAARFPDAALIIQETPQDKRTELVRSKRITFSIAKLGVEGLDDENLDTLFFLTPFGSENDLQQALGRIQRLAHDKNQPIAVIFDDCKIGPLAGLCNKLRKILKSWGMAYQTLAPPI